MIAPAKLHTCDGCGQLADMHQNGDWFCHECNDYATRIHNLVEEVILAARAAMRPNPKTSPERLQYIHDWKRRNRARLKRQARARYLRAAI